MDLHHPSPEWARVRSLSRVVLSVFVCMLVLRVPSARSDTQSGDPRYESCRLVEHGPFEQSLQAYFRDDLEKALVNSVIECPPTITRRILSLGADPTGEESGVTAVQSAAERGLTDQLDALATHSDRARALVDQWLLHARIVASLSQETASSLPSIPTGWPHLNFEDQGGETLLIKAARRGRTDAIAALSESGASLEQCTKRGESALSTAIEHGRVEVIKLLLAKGVRLFGVGCTTDGILARTLYGRRPDLLSLLIEHAARSTGEELEHFHAALQDKRLIENIITHANTRDVKRVFELGASVRRANNDGTLKSSAQQAGRLDVVHILESFGATEWTGSISIAGLDVGPKNHSYLEEMTQRVYRSFPDLKWGYRFFSTKKPWERVDPARVKPPQFAVVHPDGTVENLEGPHEIGNLTFEPRTAAGILERVRALDNPHPYSSHQVWTNPLPFSEVGRTTSDLARFRLVATGLTGAFDPVVEPDPSRPGDWNVTRYGVMETEALPVRTRRLYRARERVGGNGGYEQTLEPLDVEEFELQWGGWFNHYPLKVSTLSDWRGKWKEHQVRSDLRIDVGRGVVLGQDVLFCAGRTLLYHDPKIPHRALEGWPDDQHTPPRDWKSRQLIQTVTAKYSPDGGTIELLHVSSAGGARPVPDRLVVSNGQAFSLDADGTGGILRFAGQEWVSHAKIPPLRDKRITYQLDADDATLLAWNRNESRGFFVHPTTGATEEIPPAPFRGDVEQSFAYATTKGVVAFARWMRGLEDVFIYDRTKRAWSTISTPSKQLDGTFGRSWQDNLGIVVWWRPSAATGGQHPTLLQYSFDSGTWLQLKLPAGTPTDRAPTLHLTSSAVLVIADADDHKSVVRFDRASGLGTVVSPQKLRDDGIDLKYYLTDDAPDSRPLRAGAIFAFGKSYSLDLLVVSDQGEILARPRDNDSIQSFSEIVALPNGLVGLGKGQYDEE